MGEAARSAASAAPDARRYICPRTGEPLELTPDGKALCGPQGTPRYIVRGGIPQFLASESVDTPDQRRRLAALNEAARRDGWRSALEAVYGVGSGMLDYVTNPVRTRMLDLLDVAPGADVLEIGPGLGQMTVALARRVRSVDALEVVGEQAEFAALRCRQEECDNVALACGGDDCRWPYPVGRFDAVLANLVFEWCASRRPGEPILDVQRRFLAEARRVLRPGGRLLLTTKNRFALRYLAGKSDEHADDLRFGNALPRPLLNWLLRRRGHDRPAGLLHSHRALGRLLREAGFAEARSYWAVPEMRVPTEFIPTDADSIRAARRRPGFVQGEMRTTRLLMPLVPAGLVKHLTPGLVWLAETPAP